MRELQESSSASSKAAREAQKTRSCTGNKGEATMNKEKQEAALRMLSRPKVKPEPKPKSKFTWDEGDIEIVKPPDHSCFSCSHYATDKEALGHEDLAHHRYCAVTNSHYLRAWPFAHTVCEKWEHERAPQVEEEE
jgi:hypothetical protein